MRGNLYIDKVTNMLNLGTLNVHSLLSLFGYSKDNTLADNELVAIPIYLSKGNSNKNLELQIHKDSVY